MSWREGQLSLQLLSELRVGAPARKQVFQAKSIEDAAAEAAAATIRQMEGD